MSSPDALIAEARAARAADDEERAARRRHAQSMARLRVSERARKLYEADLAVHEERERCREAMYDDVRAVLDMEAGLDTAGARRVKALQERVRCAADAARRAADPLNLTKHTKARKPPKLKPELAEISDPSDGGRITVTINPGEWLMGRWYRQGLIGPAEFAAADWFRGRYEAADIGAIRGQDIGRVSSGSSLQFGPGDAAFTAAHDVRTALKVIRDECGARAPEVVEHLVGQGRLLKDTARAATELKFRIGEGYVIGLCRDALTAIARWRGLVAKPKRILEEQADGRGNSVYAPRIVASNEATLPPVEVKPDRFGRIAETAESRSLRAASEKRRMRART